MVREIKFRAWAKCEKTMLPDFQLHPDFGLLTEDKRFVLMQYTGLKDKNGKEIYEGDIVLQGDLIIPDIVGPVEWGSCYAASLGDEYTEMWGWIVRPKGYDPEPLFPFSGLEVIGNIYENPELLK